MKDKPEKQSVHEIDLGEVPLKLELDNASVIVDLKNESKEEKSKNTEDTAVIDEKTDLNTPITYEDSKTDIKAMCEGISTPKENEISEITSVIGESGNVMPSLSTLKSPKSNEEIETAMEFEEPPQETLLLEVDNIVDSESEIPESDLVVQEEEMVHPYRVEKEVMMEESTIITSNSQSSTTEPIVISSSATSGIASEAVMSNIVSEVVTSGVDSVGNKISIPSEILIKSHEITLEEKDGQTVAVITVPSNFQSSHSTGSSTSNISVASDANSEILPATYIVAKSPSNKNKHGYILSKSHESSAIVTPGKPKTESSKSKTPYGRVIKKEPGLGQLGAAQNILIHNISSNQPYSLLPQTIKAVSQSEGKTYSLLAPPSELKQMLKGGCEKKPVVLGGKPSFSESSGTQISDVSSPSQKVIIISHSPSTGGISETVKVTTTVPSPNAAKTETLTTVKTDELSSTVEHSESEVTTDVETSVVEIPSVVPQEDNEKVKVGVECNNQQSPAQEKDNADANQNVQTPSSEIVADVSNDENLVSENVCNTKVILEEPELMSTSAATMSAGSNDDRVEEIVEKNQELANMLKRGDNSLTSKSIKFDSTDDNQLHSEEVVVTSETEPSGPIIKIESQDNVPSPSMNVLSTALAEAGKVQNSSGLLKPQKIKLIENGIVYELQIFPEGEEKSSSEVGQFFFFYVCVCDVMKEGGWGTLEMWVGNDWVVFFQSL